MPKQVCDIDSIFISSTAVLILKGIEDHLSKEDPLVDLT